MVSCGIRLFLSNRRSFDERGLWVSESLAYVVAHWAMPASGELQGQSSTELESRTRDSSEEGVWWEEAFGLAIRGPPESYMDTATIHKGN